MTRKTEFHTVEFFRKVRDRQARVLADKSPAEIIAFFSKAQSSMPDKVRRQAREKGVRR